jgi:hypothetical protein
VTLGQHAVIADGLGKRFGSKQALHGFDLAVPEGTVTATRQLFGNPGVELAGASWPAQHALLLAVLWPVVIIAVFLPLSVHRYRSISR